MLRTLCLYRSEVVDNIEIHQQIRRDDPGYVQNVYN